ncbi:MAG: ParB/RepB/Spo0J family partition protein [Micrococcaceae bacterium]
MSKNAGKKSLSQGLDAALGNKNKTRATDIFFGGQSNDTAHFAELDVNSISPNKNQPRTHFDEEAMAELVHSLKTVGQLQPIVVRATGKNQYELIMGERRLRASKLAGKDKIAAIVRTTDDENMLRDALLENLHRSNLNALEEAAAYDQMMQDFKITQLQLSERIGRSRPHIANTLRLLKLPADVQKMLHDNTLSAGHARALVGVKDKTLQLKLAQQAIAQDWSVRQLEQKITAKPHAVSQKSQKVVALSEELTQRYNIPATVTQKGEGGRVTFVYKNDAELQKLLQALK